MAKTKNQSKTVKTTKLGVTKGKKVVNRKNTTKKQSKKDLFPYALFGPGNDLKHQYFISRLIVELSKKYKNKSYYILPEYHDSGYIPDVCVLKESKDGVLEYVTLIEICGNSGFENDTKKLKKLASIYKTVKECFVFNKDTNDLFCIKGDNAPVKTNVIKGIKIDNIVKLYNEKKDN